MVIGILALQGAFEAHRKAIEPLGAEAILVKTPAQMNGIHGLVLPGGESTTIWQMMERSDLLGPVREWTRGGRPVLGTCAGAILLARDLDGSDQPTLGAVDITVRRNAYGRQRESFEALLEIPSLGEEPLPGVFIRAPKFTRLGDGVEVLGEHDAEPVLLRAGRALLAAFHPELTDDRRIHRAFLDLCAEPAKVAGRSR